VRQLTGSLVLADDLRVDVACLLALIGAGVVVAVVVCVAAGAVEGAVAGCANAALDNASAVTHARITCLSMASLLI
jgi:hypothetical protein